MMHRLARDLLVISLAITTTQTIASQPLRDLEDFRIDERKELHAVASRTLTWLTGTAEQNDYISVGRLANFFGFIKFRVASGNSLTRSGAAQETYAQLTDSQRERLLQLLDEQRGPFERTIALRLDMNRMLDRVRSGERVDRAAFIELGGRYGKSEAELGRVIATGLGEIAQTLDEDQRDSLAALRTRSLAGNAGKFALPRGLRDELRGGTDTQELWNLAARLLTWVTGTPEDNDFETVGKPSQHFGFVSLRVESGHAVKRGGIAREVLALLSGAQRAELDAVVRDEIERFDAFLEVRGSVCRELERALSGGSIRPVHLAMYAGAMGRMEAEMTWGQALGILAVRDTMTGEQAQEFLAIRDRYVPEPAGDGHATPASPTGEETPSLLAASIARGRQLFAQCALCHVASDGARAAGPTLDGVVGRPIASASGYPSYSPAMRRHAGVAQTWTEAHLDTFLLSPRRAVPGTMMGFNGIANDADRAALIAYLKARSEP